MSTTKDNKDVKFPPDTTEKAAKAVDEVSEEMSGQTDNLVTLSTGVVIKFKQIPPGIMIKVLTKIKKPEVPKIYIERDDVWVQNPDHPEHIKAMEWYELESSGFLLNVMLLKGTEIVKFDRRRTQGPESDGWLEDFKVLGLDILADNKSWRKLNWLLSVAAATDKDFEAISKGVGELSGVPEENVAEAAKFPGRDQDGGDSGAP